MEELTHDISYTDLMHRGRSRVIAAAVIRSASGVTLVDPGPTSCLGRLRVALAETGIEISDLLEGAESDLLNSEIDLLEKLIQNVF